MLGSGPIGSGEVVLPCASHRFAIKRSHFSRSHVLPPEFFCAPQTRCCPSRPERFAAQNLTVLVQWVPRLRALGDKPKQALLITHCSDLYREIHTHQVAFGIGETCRL